GVIVERRDQVLITLFLFASFSASTFLSRWSSTNGPFFKLRGMCSYLPTRLSASSWRPAACGQSSCRSPYVSESDPPEYRSGSPDDARRPCGLHHRRVGGPPGSSIHRARSDACRANGSGLPCPIGCWRVPSSRPLRRSRGYVHPHCESRWTASEAGRSAPLWPLAALECPRNARSSHHHPAAARSHARSSRPGCCVVGDCCPVGCRRADRSRPCRPV